MERGEKKAYLNHSQHQKSENDNFCHFFFTNLIRFYDGTIGTNEQHMLDALFIPKAKVLITGHDCLQLDFMFGSLIE